MEDPKTASRIESLISHLLGFLEAKTELLKLELREELARIISKIIATQLLAVIVALFLFFCSVALGSYLNYIWDSSYLGFVALAGWFLLLGIVVVLLMRTQWYQDRVGAWTERFFESYTQDNETKSGVEDH